MKAKEKVQIREMIINPYQSFSFQYQFDGRSLMDKCLLPGLLVTTTIQYSQSLFPFSYTKKMTAMAIRLFLVDDHKLVTDAWTAMLNADTRFDVIGATNNPATALSSIRELKPDIVLLDISMTPVDGFSLTQSIKEFDSKTGIIVISYYDLPVYYTRIMKAGANGYITKTSASEELKEAIIQVAGGNNYTCREIGETIIENMINPGEMLAAIKSLTPKQLDIIELIKKGLSSKEIAAYLGVSHKTIEVHRYNILKKLGLKNSAALINEMNTRGI